MTCSQTCTLLGTSIYLCDECRAFVMRAIMDLAKKEAWTPDATNKLCREVWLTTDRQFRRDLVDYAEHHRIEYYPD